MKKRTIIIAALASMLSTMPAFAAEPMVWNIDPTTWDYYEGDWTTEESITATKKWAESYRAQIEELSTEYEKFDFIATTVRDFFTYDMEYATLVDTYGYRDGKGVCEDYARSVKALCDVAGIPCTYEMGDTPMGPHAWNSVTLGGTTHYCDITSYDSLGTDVYRLTTSLWEGFSPYASTDELDVSTIAGACNTTYTDGGFIPDPGSNIVQVIGRSGKTVYITKEDADALDNDIITLEDLIVKYPDIA